MTIDLEALRETWDFEAKLAGGNDGRGALPTSMWETYSAMANSHGGVIVLGLKENADGSFKVQGIDDVDRLQRDLWNLLANRQKVSVDVVGRDDVETDDVDGKTILVMRVRQATRQERPVHLNGNPLGNTFVRTHDGDRRCDNDRVRRMIAEAITESRDNRVLPHFTLADLDAASIKTYRNVFSARRIDHPWNGVDDREFLSQLGAWRTDRETGAEGLTVAGLLMFGQHRAIREALGNYFVDYQERDNNLDVIEWVDRVVPDGTWSGNLYEFYRRVIGKLTVNLRVPFQLDDDLHRREETHVHEALREALVNTLIHADYEGSVSTLVVKRPDSFEFRNPGALRLSTTQIRTGGLSDCRNRTLQQIFLMLGIGEQAGSGYSRILRAWREQSWQAPSLVDSVEPDQTTLVLRMVSLLPPEVVDELKERYGDVFNTLNENQRLAVVTAAIEGMVTNRRLQELTNVHGRDLTYLLRDMVRDGMLVPHGERQARWYTLTHATAILGTGQTELSSGQTELSSGQTGLSSGQSSGQTGLSAGQSSGQTGLSTGQSSGQTGLSAGHGSGQTGLSAGQSSGQTGLSTGHSSGQTGLSAGHSSGQTGLSSGQSSGQSTNPDAPIAQHARFEQLAPTLSTPPRAAGAEAAVVALCRDEWRSITDLVHALKRSRKSVRRYVRALQDRGALRARHPDEPTHPDQADRAFEESPGLTCV